MKDETRGQVAVLAAALLWSTGGLGVKLVDASPLAIAGFRSFFAAPVVALALFGVLRPTKGDLRALLRQPLLWGAGLSYAVVVVTFVAAVKLTTAANAVLLQYTGPVYVALLSWPLLKERVRAADWIAVGATAAGMALFFRDQLSPSGMSGNLLAVGSSFAFAALPLLLRLLQLRLGGTQARPVPFLAILLGNGMASAFCSPWMVTAGPHTAVGWGVLVALGSLQIGLAYVLFAEGIRRLRAVEAILLATAEPILSPLWVLLGTGERPSPSALAGGALIVAAVTFQGLAAAMRQRATREVVGPSP